MFEDILKLTTADFNALNALDADYLLDKGANFYNLGEYGQAVEYYRLAAMLGSVQAIANLGYCYLYGRQIKANLDLALAYFKVAAQKENIDAAYKLGDIYGSTKWGIQDDELSNYYYRQAVNFILGKDSAKAELLVWHHELQEYPSLCFALGRQKSKNGKMLTNIAEAYQFLKHAELGYLQELSNGHLMYEKTYAQVKQLLADSQFDPVRAKYDQLFAEEY